MTLKVESFLSGIRLPSIGTLCVVMISLGEGIVVGVSGTVVAIHLISRVLGKHMPGSLTDFKAKYVPELFWKSKHPAWMN